MDNLAQLMNTTIMSKPLSRDSSAIVDLHDAKYGESSVMVKAVALAQSMGMTTAEISSELGIVEGEVQKIALLPITQSHLRRLLTSVDPVRLNGILKATAVDATVKMRQLLSNANPAIALAAAKYIIDRSLGHSEPSRKPVLDGVSSTTDTLAQLREQISDSQRKLGIKL